MKKKFLVALTAALALTTQVAMASPNLGVTTPEGTQQNGITIQSVSLAVPLYSQSGQTWSSQVMSSCGSTISAAGCTLTSTAMVFKYYGVAIDPGQLNVKMGASACPLVYGDAVTKAGAGIVRTVATSSPTAWSTVYSAAKAALDSGKPYIVGMNKPAGGTHFVVISGYATTGASAADFTIKDPAGGVTRTLSYYTGLSYTPYRGVVYSK
ncbi:C39 family peptidase [Tumebacillus permanentifrigoris]|uniref:Peptidase C39-like protein n=1 Tax=Tumebacillus permanentifrigoris TaxID=378543 RepID=A0A316D4F2_9BACL|nr:C39 family peptidase [Tumebacillus permanentifrigoris]PWK07450.1 peptidase C39-like protein [Tumebacillus permanentifrigoris]